MTTALAGAAGASPSSPSATHHARPAAHHARAIAHHAKTGAPAVLRWPVVGLSAKGERVWAIQYLLDARGYRLKADGVFSSSTRVSVTRFQKATKLTRDGIVGPATWNGLVLLVKFGSQGDAVSGLQHNLRAYGYTKVLITGYFGPETRDAVKAFQRAHKLTADGIVGMKTWNVLVWNEK
jgi:peptidoglycan hydrolase-like protein with peptidoglycan-binding domain